MRREKFVKLKATEDEQRTWIEYSRRRGIPLSRIIRQHMESCLARESELGKAEKAQKVGAA